MASIINEIVDVHNEIPDLELVLEEDLVLLPADGVELGQGLFQVRVCKSLEKIVTVNVVVGGSNHQTRNVGDEGLANFGDHNTCPERDSGIT